MSRSDPCLHPLMFKDLDTNADPIPLKAGPRIRVVFSSEHTSGWIQSAQSGGSDLDFLDSHRGNPKMIKDLYEYFADIEVMITLPRRYHHHGSCSAHMHARRERRYFDQIRHEERARVGHKSAAGALSTRRVERRPLQSSRATADHRSTSEPTAPHHGPPQRTASYPPPPIDNISPPPHCQLPFTSQAALQVLPCTFDSSHQISKTHPLQRSCLQVITQVRLHP